MRIRATAGVISVAGATVALLALSNGLASSEAPGSVEAGSARRVWRDDVLAPRPTRFPARGDELMGPQDVAEGPNGHVYVLDFGDRAVKQFTPAGELVRVYGRGRGAGPGELMNPTHFSVTPSGDVWILDPAQSRIQVFAPSGAARRVIRVETPASRLVVHRDGSYTLLGLSEWLLYRFTAADSLVRGFGQVMPDQRRNTLAIQGEVAGAPDGGVVYGPLRAGFLARFTASGDLVYHRPTIEPRPYPRVEVLRNGGRMVAAEFRNVLSTRAVSVDRDEVWVLTRAAVNRRQRWAVDVYSLADGAYRHSFVVPQDEVSSMHVTPRHLYLVGETTVARWQRRR